MSEGDKYMDESFQKMSEELKGSYQSDFWKEMEQQLDNASMDDAFQSAVAEGDMVIPALPVDLDLGDVDDAFMDDAFKEAANETTVGYQPAFWDDFQASVDGVEMDEAFITAAKNTKANYQPQFWTAASTALEEEGLHYEYKKAYWNEARALLDKSDRKGFFYRWSGIAAVLLLISGVAFNMGQAPKSLTGISRVDQKNFSETKLAHRFNTADNVNSINEGLALNSLAEESESADLEGYNTNQSNRITENNNEGDINADTDYIPAQLASLDVANNDVIEEEDLTNDLNNSESIENSIAFQTPAAFEPEVLTNESLDRKSEIEKLEVDVESIPVSPLNNQLMSLAPIKKYKPRLMHEVSLIGMAGFGNKYDTDGFLAEQRNSLGLSYALSGLGNRNNLEFEFSAMGDRIKVNGLNYQDISAVYDNYGGRKRYWYNVAYQNVFYATGNLGLNYNLGNRHKIGLGIGLSKLVAVQTNVAQLNKKDYIEVTNNNWGVLEGFNAFDTKLRIGYEYTVSNNFSVRVDANVGMNDRTDDYYFEKGSFDREKTIMIGLKYVIFRGVK